MSDNANEAKNTVQPWIASLGISVFCCAVFFVIISNYIGQLTDAMNKMEARLASIESRPTEPTPTVAPINVVIPQPATISTVPPIETPSLAVPGSSGSGVPGTVPSAAPAPEAVAPVMPAVPSMPTPTPVEAPATH